MRCGVLSFGKNSLKTQLGLNSIIFLSKFFKEARSVEPYSLLVKIFEKVSMGCTILPFGQIFEKDNVGWSILSLGEHILTRQYWLNHIVFWSKCSKRTTWVEPYYLLLKIFLKGNMGWTILSFGQIFLKTLYRFNHIVLLLIFWKRQ